MSGVIWGQLTLTKAPKMLLIAATEGKGTLKMANWRFSLFGTSFLPPPGMFMAAKYLHNKLSQLMYSPQIQNIGQCQHALIRRVQQIRQAHATQQHTNAVTRAADKLLQHSPAVYNELHVTNGFLQGVHATLL